MELTFEELQFDSSSTVSLDKIIDYTSDRDFLYLLGEDHIVNAFDHSLIYHKTIHLTNTRATPTAIFVDDTNLIIGYSDGTLEFRLIDEDYGLLRISSTRDAAGPGKKTITSISGSAEYILVLASENGLMIYTKPSLLFYKWIMLGGHCTISEFSIKENLLYVLRDNFDIHMLDFDKHRIFEQMALTYDYLDIVFDGDYLFAATKTSVLVFLQEIAERPQKLRLVSQMNFKEQIVHLMIISQQLLVVFQSQLIPLLIDNSMIHKPIITMQPSILSPSNNGLRKLKYSFFHNTLSEVNPIPFFFFDKQQKTLYKISFKNQSLNI